MNRRGKNLGTTAIPDGHVIALYKKDSRGEIVARYSTISSIVKEEKKFNRRFAYSSITYCMASRGRAYKSLVHQCWVVPRIIPVEQVA